MSSVDGNPFTEEIMCTCVRGSKPSATVEHSLRKNRVSVEQDESPEIPHTHTHTAPGLFEYKVNDPSFTSNSSSTPNAISHVERSGKKSKEA